MVIPNHPDVTLWPWLASASGSAGTVTASRNEHGPFFRERVTPANPDTRRQRTVRLRFAAIHDWWVRNTSDAQKEAWCVYARSVPVRGRLGDKVYITGRNWFSRINLVRGNSHQSILLNPPTDLTAAGSALCLFKYTRTPQLLSVSRDTLQDFWPEPGAVYSHYVTADYPTSIQSFKPPWLFLGTRPCVGPAVVFLSLPFTPATGNRIFTRYRLQRADGRLSPWMFDSGIVTAT